MRRPSVRASGVMDFVSYLHTAAPGTAERVLEIEDTRAVLLLDSIAPEVAGSPACVFDWR